MPPSKGMGGMTRALFGRGERGPGEFSGSAGHRDDLQGLRAVAVLLVALSHAGVGFLKGGYVGVDVFFVLSGFLITGLLLSEAAKYRSVSLAGFYTRRARRILPAAALTLVVTEIVAYRLLNFVRAKQIIWDSIWASGFVANVRFARVGTDYFAQAQPPSPLQHFWTLAVEEQFYLVWPALLFVVLFGFPLTGRLRHHRGKVTGRSLARLFLVVAVVAAASLAWSIHYTKVSPTGAYFSTLTRAWELALGAALAVITSRLAGLPRAARAAAGWAGFAAIAAAGVMFSSSTAFPGYAALLPTIGAALVISAGIASQPRAGVVRLLALAPLRYVGDRSYTFYLWHWPVLIIAAQYEGHALSVTTKLLLLLGAFLLSIITYGVYENPIRRAEWTQAASAFLWPASVAAVIMIATFALTSIDTKELHLQEASAAASAAAPVPDLQPKAIADPIQIRDTVGSVTASVLPAVVEAVKAAQRRTRIPSGLTPSIGELAHDYYVPPSGCTPPDGRTSSNICRLGSSSSARSIAVIGDSHAMMWMPAILSMAETDGWAVVPLWKTGCTPDAWTGLHGSAECRAWYRWAVGQAKQLRPTVTLISGAYGGSYGARADAVVQAISSLSTTTGTFSKEVVVVGDTPRQSEQPTDCLLRSNATMDRCTRTWTDQDLSVIITLSSAVSRANAGFLDTTGWFCFANRCPMVIGRTIAYIDTGHLSKSYATVLAAPFRAAFRQTMRRIGSHR
jgi:peptidoglycan/LPS O-acetylase OafA/YrhL